MSKDKERERSLEKEIESEKVGGVRKKVVSPNIQKIREVFEKSEKVIPEKEKKGEKVSRLRNGFELMMDDTETRKKKFEMKKKRNKIVGLKGTPCKSTIDKWVGGGGLRKVEVIENEIGSVRKISVSDKTKSGSKSVNKISKASQILSKQVKVEYTTPESKHRKDVAIEKTIFIKKLENVQKEDLNSKKVQKEMILGRKVKILNELFETGGGAEKLCQKTEEKSLGGPDTNKKPNQVRKKQGQQLLRGADSLGRKRAK